MWAPIAALLGVAVALAAWPVFACAQRCKTAWSEMRSFEHAVSMYQTDNNGDCPASLDELVEGHYLPRDPRDPWGRPFDFRCPGLVDRDGADVRSAGVDGVMGTADDIGSWETKEQACNKPRLLTPAQVKWRRWSRVGLLILLGRALLGTLGWLVLRRLGRSRAGSTAASPPA